MKERLWLFNVPPALLLLAAFIIHDLGADGRLPAHGILSEQLFPVTRRISSTLTDLKFRWRGKRAPKNPIVIIDIDAFSIEKIGRWPWRRDYVAFLIQRAFEEGAEVVGLDVFFPEAEELVPADLKEKLEGTKFAALLKAYESDEKLAAIARKYGDRLVVTWGSEAICQPRYSSKEICPVADEEKAQDLPETFERFAIQDVTFAPGFDREETPLFSASELHASYPQLYGAAKHQAYINGFRDFDGAIRRTALVMMINGAPHPALALEMARIGRKEDPAVKFGSDHRVAELRLGERALPVNGLGGVDINFRGPGETFAYVSAQDLFQESSRELASKTGKLKGAYAIVGVSALGLHDRVVTPFDREMPGVEAHATVLDNLLSGDLLSDGRSYGSFWILFTLMLFALVATYFVQRMEALHLLGVFSAFFAVMAVVDARAFAANQNWPTAFLYLQIFTAFLVTIAVRYVIEERNKKFLRNAFGRYVSPKVVDAIVRDHGQLTVGGRREEITTLFCDIRNFTHLSETMDAKFLSEFLNEYFTLLTSEVFRESGTLDKYIGDALMAFWGAPLAEPLQATRACASARALVNALEAHGSSFEKKYGIIPRAGVGINFGVASVGNMGTVTNMAYTALGDAVNVASRLETATKSYGVDILASRECLDRIRAEGVELPPHRLLDTVRLKGKDHPITLIEILAKDLDPEALTRFEEARALYLARKWKAAEEGFVSVREELARSGIEDGPSRIFAERCAAFRKEPPPKDWGGIWTLG